MTPESDRPSAPKVTTPQVSDCAQFLKTSVELVMPAPLESWPVVYTVDSTMEPSELDQYEIPTVRILDSPDDIFSEHFGGSRIKIRAVLSEDVQDFLRRIVEGVREPGDFGTAQEQIEAPNIVVRLGPAILQERDSQVVFWIELYSEDTGEYLMPDLSVLYDPLLQLLSSDYEASPPERFSAGVARLIVKLPRSIAEDIVTIPWVSVESSAEISQAFLTSVRSNGGAATSYIHAMLTRYLYHNLFEEVPEESSDSPSYSWLEHIRRELELDVERITYSTDGNFDVYLKLTGKGDLKDRLDSRGITGCIARLGVGDLDDFTLRAVKLR